MTYKQKYAANDDPSARPDRLQSVIDEASTWLVERQKDDGHWLFELEADATISSEYILLNHYLGTIDDATEAKLAKYLLRLQSNHGGWPLYHDGDFDMSASVKAYYALKMTGEDTDSQHMTDARNAILDRGGAAKANVFTRITLALFGQLPWRAVPVMRVEAMLLPTWSPFHIDKVSYWSRTVMVPLLVLASLKPMARNPRRIHMDELFVTPPDQVKKYLTNPTGHWLGKMFLGLDWVARKIEPLFPDFLRRRAIDKAMSFVRERLNGEDGLGGIFPAIANSLMAFDALGYSHDHPDFVVARKAVDGLLTFNGDSGYCQPCLSPIWDTGLAIHAMLEVNDDKPDPIVDKALDWILHRQILDVRGDWIAQRPDIRPGGWAFQCWNDYYPDVDDTAVVVSAMQRADPELYKESIERAVEWIIGMQSNNGGWGAFDANNEYYFLQHIPFADHGAMLDPPTADVSARCVGMLAQLGYDKGHQAVANGLDFIRRGQESDGSWFGRWGNNYVYGTWSVLAALNAVGEDMQADYIQRAVRWLKSRQRHDGGWGEDCASYWQHRRDMVKESTPSQTSWALLALLAAGEIDSKEVEDGIAYLLNAPREGGDWHEEYFNAVGFPRVFYLRYHGYSFYFPLWTLARYRNLKRSGKKKTDFGI